MKLIGTKTHGYLDYLVGILLIVAPWLLGFYRGGMETYVPVILGVVTIIYSLMTDYEMGPAKLLSMRAHLVLDFLSGALLAASPWLFNFNQYIILPHLIVGIAEMLIASVTQTHPSTERPIHQRRYRTDPLPR